MENAIEKELAKMNLDGSNTWRFHHGEIFKIFHSNQDKASRVIVAAPDAGAEQPFFTDVINSFINDPETWGLVDTDGIAWSIQIGNSFHGIRVWEFPNRDDIQMALEILLSGIDLDENPHSWVIITMVDFAS